MWRRWFSVFPAHRKWTILWLWWAFSICIIPLRKPRVRINIGIHVYGQNKKVLNGNSTDKYGIILSRYKYSVRLSQSSIHSGHFLENFQVLFSSFSAGAAWELYRRWLRMISVGGSFSEVSQFLWFGLHWNKIQFDQSLSSSLSLLEHVFFYLDPSMHAVDYRSSAWIGLFIDFTC